ncbi:MAG: hypothetical protein AABZ60_01710 [Planctomycetota bacterium]
MNYFSRLVFAYIITMLMVLGCTTTEIKDDGTLRTKIQMLEQQHNKDKAEMEALIRSMSKGGGSTGITCGSNGGLRVSANGPSNAIRGANTTYQVKVANVTNCPGRDIEVYAYLPNGVQFVGSSDGGQNSGDMITWHFRELGAGDELTVSYEIILPESGVYRSCVYASARFLDCIETRVAEPVLACNWTAPERVRKGSDFEACIEITNTGDGDATSVSVEISLTGLEFSDGSASRTWSNVTIAAGRSARECWTLRGTTDGNGEIQAVVRMSGGAQAATCGKTVQVATPDLAIIKTGPSQVNINSRFKFKIEVSNPSESTNTNVMVNDSLPEGLEFAEASDGGSYNSSNRSVQWSLGDLAPGATKELTVSVKAVLEKGAPGWCNVASVRSNEVPAKDAQACTIVEAVPAMHIDGYDTEDPVQVGDTTTYVIDVRNEGKKAATNMQLVFTLDEEAGYISHEATFLGRTLQGNVSGNVVTFDVIVTMNPGDQASYKITAKALEAGSALGTATVTFAEFSKPFQKQEPTTFYK